MLPKSQNLVTKTSCRELVLNENPVSALHRNSTGVLSIDARFGSLEALEASSLEPFARRIIYLCRVSLLTFESTFL